MKSTLSLFRNSEFGFQKCANFRLTASNLLSVLAFFLLFNTVPVSAQYCVSKSSAPWELWIKKVSLNTINYESEKFSTYSSLGYSDFTTINTTLIKGQSYPLSITAGVSWSGILNNAYCRAWIDWNRNNVFENEEVVFQNTNANPFFSNLLVPISAQLGATRMRIAVKSGNYPSPCESFGSGEVEDYTVTIAEVITQTGNDILQITNASAATSVAPNGNVNVTFTVKNKGTTPNSPDKTLKLSTGTSNSGKRSTSYEFTGISNDVPIGIAISPDSTRTITRSFNINADYSPIAPYPTPYEAILSKLGTHIGLSTTNYFSNISNSYDTFPAPLALNVTLPYADLEITMQPLPPMLIGNEVNYTVKVKNKSAETVPDVEARVFNLGYYTFDSAALSPSKGTTVAYNAVGNVYTVAGYWRVGSLAPNEEATSVVQLRSNFWRVTGSGPSMRADVQSLRRYDTVTVNNSANLSFLLDNVNLPDLTLSNIIVSTPSVSQSQILYFKFDASNIGTVDALRGFKIKSYLSTDQILDANDYQDGSISTANYTAGTNIAQIQGAMTVANTLQVGNYYLILRIDADNDVRESNESNNNLVFSNLISVTNATGGGNGTNDIALSLVSTPSVYRQYTNQNFKISAKNNSNQAFTNVKIDFPYPKKTVNGGVVTPSVGTWQEWCSGGTRCYTWTIPSLAANTTATLDVPVYVLDAVGLLTATTNLLSSTPVDNVTINNSVTVLVGAANAPIIQPLNQLIINSKPIELNKGFNSELNKEINQRIYPTIAENNIVVELESKEGKQINCQIINSLGTIVLNKQLTLEQGSNPFSFNISQLPKGVYFVQTSSGGLPMKFVKY